jgi:hypothetical protein
MTPIVQKILLELEGIKQPLELWWTDEYLNHFRKNEKDIMVLAPLRIPNTSSSILEVNLEFFKGVLETGEYDIISPESLFKKTVLYNYFIEIGIPVPKSSFNEEFKYPSTLIVIKDKTHFQIRKLDFSNYTNLDYLVSQKRSLPDHLNSKKEYLPSEFSAEQFIFAEYSSMKVPTG